MVLVARKLYFIKWDKDYTFFQGREILPFGFITSFKAHFQTSHSRISWRVDSCMPSIDYNTFCLSCVWLGVSRKGTWIEGLENVLQEQQSRLVAAF